MMIKKNHKILRQSIDSTIYGPVYGQRMHVARISVAHFHSHSHNLFVVSKIDNEIKTRRRKKNTDLVPAVCGRHLDGSI